jgi:N-acetylmuramoyl-L-alanine amidase
MSFSTLRSFWLCILLLSAHFMLTLRAQPAPAPGIRTLIIDPGHGGRDPGAVGRNYLEKDITLAVAQYLRDMIEIELPHIEVIMTRETDKAVSLASRAKLAQHHHADFFISIHCNSSENRHSSGTESYVLGYNPGQESFLTYVTENKAILYEENYQEVYGDFEPNSPEAYIFFNLSRNIYRAESLRLAEKVQRNFTFEIGRESRGVKQAPFMVLWLSGIPGILTEIGFISNKQEEAYLSSAPGQKAIARCLFKAIQEYDAEQ